VALPLSVRLMAAGLRRAEATVKPGPARAALRGANDLDQCAPAKVVGSSSLFAVGRTMPSRGGPGGRGMGLRTQWVTGRPDAGGMLARLQGLGGIVRASSAYEPVPCDLDEFGDMDGDLFSIAAVDLGTDAVLPAIDAAVAATDRQHVLVVDFAHDPLQVRMLPTAGSDHIVVKARSGARRFPRGKDRHARQLIRRLMRRRAAS
jgi:hypothetical protein